MSDDTPRHPVPDEVPREQQRLELPEPTLETFRPWATEGTALTAAARVTDPAGRVALVRNRWSDGWVLPGGAVEPAEDPVAAARREVREETGLDAAVDAPLVVFEQTYATTDGVPRFDAEYVVYDARADGSIPPADELGVHDGEIDAARWFETPPANLEDGDLLRGYL